MKLYNLIVALVCTLFIVSCGNEYDTTEYFDLEDLPGYVAFDAAGNNVNVADQELGENGGVVLVTVENPTGTFSDITVNYSLGGTAVFGVDYTIDGATAAGGSMVISADRGDVNVTYRGDIIIGSIDNEDADGDKTIVLTLTSASNSDGDIVVGRGGKDFQKVANVIIVDDECPSEYGGMYSVSTTYIQIDTNIVDTVFTEDGYVTTINKTGDFTYMIEEASGGLYTSTGLYGINKGTTGMTLNITEDCGGVSFGGEVDELGQDITMGSGGNGVDGDGVFTISIATSVATSDTTSMVNEIFTSTYTPM